MGEPADQAEIEALTQRFGLDQPLYKQYLYWAWNFLHGDMGHSFEWNRPVSSLIAERIPLTDSHFYLHIAFHMGGFGPNRRIFGCAAVLVGGLFSDLHRFYRLGDS